MQNKSLGREKSAVSVSRNVNSTGKVRGFKISAKINLAFVGIILLFIMVLFLNIYMVNSVTNTKDLLSESYECLNIIKDMEKFVSVEKNIQNSVLSVGKMSESSSLFTEPANNFDNEYKRILEHQDLLSSEELEKLESFAALHKEYSDLFYNETLKIGKNISNGVAEDIETDQKRIDMFRKLESMNGSIQDTITVLTDSLQSKIDSYNEDIASGFSYMLLYFVSAVLAAIVLTVLFSMLLSRSILTNIKHLLISAEALGNGNLTTNIKVSSNDEVGYLGKVFSNTVEKLRSLIEKISMSSHTIFATSDQVLSYNDEAQKNAEETTQLITIIAEGAQKQQENIEEIYANANSISASINDISENVSLLLQYANQTNSVGLTSLDNLNETVSQISHINNEIHHTSELIQNLQVKSKNIESIADIIRDIASQTNLLSLNASIEAARAGEQGKGFTVVADEIRKLALQVGDSSKNILVIIKDINNEIKLIYEKMNSNTIESEKGISLVSKTGESFNSIIKSVNQQLDRINTLSGSMNNLSSGFGNINNAMQEIVDSSEGIAVSTKEASETMHKQLSMSQELSSAATELSKVANELQNIVSVFKV